MTDILTLNSLYGIISRRGNTGTYGIRRLQKATVLSAVAGGLNTSVCSSWLSACLQRYLVAVRGIALQQQRREELDQSLIAEDAALLEQKSVLEPAIPQLSSVGGEAYAAREGGNKRGGWKTEKRDTILYFQ